MTEPLRYACQNIDEDDIAAVVRVLRSDYLTSGPEIPRFEQALAEYVGAKYAVAVSSGTAALHLAYLAVGYKVIETSPLSFVATANAALLADYDEVRFIDVEPATGLWNIKGYDCAEGKVVLVPVHYAGQAAPILPREDCYAGIVTIEDACHALGAMDFDGCSRVGSCAHSLAAVFSFHAVKPLCCGEGGMVTTNDQGFADEVRSLRSHGRDADGRMVNLGLNYRMTDIQAALGTSQLARCDEMREQRLWLAAAYDAKLYGVPVVKPPSDTQISAWHLYPVRIKNGRRDEVKAKLNEQGLGVQVHYHPIHLQPFWQERGGYAEGAFPEAEAWGAEELSLPLHSRMTERDVERVVDALRRAAA